MKIIHTSDWHLGHMIEGKFPREEEQLAMLAQMADMVREYKPDAFVISGDIYDTTVPSASSQKMLSDALVDLHEANPAMHIFCIAGNHDSGAKHMIYSRPWRSMNVHMVGGINNESNLEDYVFKVDGAGYFVTVPFAAARFMPEDVFKKLSDLVGQRNTEEGLPVVLLAHTTVGSCDSTGHDLADDEQVGGIRKINLEEFGTDYDYVALGHIHRQQKLDAEGKIRYCGTPIAISFDESKPGNDHGVLMVECDGHGKDVKVSHLHIDNPKPLVNIPTTGLGQWEDVISELRSYPGGIPAYIRLNVEIKDYLPSGAVDEARIATKDKKCVFCKINVQRQREEASGGGKSLGTKEMKDPVEVAQIWFREVKGYKDFEKRVAQVVTEAMEEINSEDRAS